MFITLFLVMYLCVGLTALATKHRLAGRVTENITFASRNFKNIGEQMNRNMELGTVSSPAKATDAAGLYRSRRREM